MPLSIVTGTLCTSVELAESKECVVGIILPKWSGHFGSSLGQQILKNVNPPSTPYGAGTPSGRHTSRVGG